MLYYFKISATSTKLPLMKILVQTGLRNHLNLDLFNYLGILNWDLVSLLAVRNLLLLGMCSICILVPFLN